MQDLRQRQEELEQEYSDTSVARGIQAMQQAIEDGRVSDTSAGRKVVAAAFETVQADLQAVLTQAVRGVGGKYRNLLRSVPVEVSAIVGIRICLNAAVQDITKAGVMDVLLRIGEAVEAESIVAQLEELNPVYLKRTSEYLHSTKTKSTHHRARTYSAAGANAGLPRTVWSTEDRVGVGRLVCTSVFSSGLFQWIDMPSRRSFKLKKVLSPTPPLVAVMQDAVNYARAMVKHPPMLVPPEPWTHEDAGGYLTKWMQVRSPRIHLRYSIPEADRNWMREQLADAQELRDACNKAQAVPYRVNPAVANLLRRAMQEGGVMGLPRREAPPPPEFPHPEGWDKNQASPDELELFSEWKVRMRLYYTHDELRRGKLYAAAFASKELLRFYGDTLYFPTFVDWRGRLYFASDLNPQSHDFVKAGLEFAEGKKLGADGLFWLKVHVATCAGFDKMDFPLRAAWTDENIPMLARYVQDPLNHPAPDPEQCWVLYAAARALLEALRLPDPTQYVCHVPISMDATCSGLQHWSAMLRDEVGGLFTNLVDNGLPQKSDIYREVASKAMRMPGVASAPFLVRSYWETLGIARSMAKRPTMTYVYGAKLMGAADYVYEEMVQAGCEPIKDADGANLYGLLKLATHGAKALREAVAATVPAAAEGMAYLQSTCRMNDAPLRWVAPTGMPVVNWYSVVEERKVEIRSMGVRVVVMQAQTGEYDRAKAANGISPNFVHSYDAAHMHKTINAFSGRIVPIHDSFACHASDVRDMHEVIRGTFLGMYLMTKPLDTLICEHVPAEQPRVGNLRLQSVLDSRFFVC